MIRARLFAPVVLLLLLAQSILAKPALPTQSPVTFEQVKPVLSKYCFDCHSDKRHKGDLSLEAFQTEAQAAENRAVWEKVLHNIETHEMPPRSKPQLSDPERALITRWIEMEILHCDCNKPDPGRVTIRRLNRAEYNNTIRDLVGVDFQAAASFPNDDSGYGFDNIGDVLSLPPVLLEKYLAAAEKILTAAIITQPDTNGPASRLNGGSLKANVPGRPITNGKFFRLEREGEIYTDFHFAKNGSYLFRLQAYGEQAGDEPPKMELRFDGRPLEVFPVSAEDNDPQIYEHRLNVPAGTHRIAVAYLNNFRDTNAPKESKWDRNLVVQYLEVLGPAGPQVYPETHRRIFSRKAGASADENGRARQIIGDFATRAFRRPVTPAELDRLMKIYAMARRDHESLESSVRYTLEAVLVSPHFLFRGELQTRPNDGTAVQPIDDYALASRLSYFLWSSMPDDRLFELAATKRLRPNLTSETRRMLRDPKAQAFVENFVGQWLQLRNLKSSSPDSTEFPTFDEDLRSAMQEETELTFAYVLRENRSVIDLLDCNYSFVNDRLAEHYGIKDVRGPAFRKITFSDHNRGGLLTQGSVLTLTSNPTRTSPVKRGKWVLENLLGSPPPPPPPNVPELKDAKHDPLQGTLRQRLEQHRENPACAGCHARMDPIGFGLENFNGIGQWRAKDGESPVDSSGELVTGEDFRGPAELKRILAASKRDEFTQCLTRKMLTYALGRGLETYDKCAVDAITKELRQENYRMSALILAIVQSTPFQMRRGDSVGTAAR
jgi:hypothetical protein